MHMCLVCNKTINGLLNYVNHKKNECSGKKATKKADTASFPETGFTSASGTTAALSQSGTQSFDNETYFMGNSYTNVQPGNLNTGNLITDQTTFLHTDGLSSPNGNFLQETADDFQKILSTTTQAIHPEGGLLSGQISLSVDANNQSADSTHLTYSLSPVFSSTQGNSDGKTGVDNVNSLTSSISEDHGIMNAIIKGVASPRRRPRTKHSLPLSYDSHFGEAEATGFTSKKTDGEEKEVIEDFFQSLELMSKTDPRVEKGSSFNQLPISNILNNLTFSSDEEDLSFNFAEDVSFDSLTDDSGDEMAPPRQHTGGKWKPGEKPAAYRKNRSE